MLKLRAIRCGKKGCKKCPHGWYMYAQWKERGKVKEKYLGKFGDPDIKDKVNELAKDHPRVSGEFETLQLSLVPGLNEKILKGINTPLSECQEDKNKKECEPNANATGK